MKRFVCLTLVWLVGLSFGQTVVLAENRALLVGIGQYGLPGADLPGIDLDLNNMKQVLVLMGFRNDQIKVITNNSATRSGIRQAMEEWLVNGVSARDRVVFYYSGHGSQVRDTNQDESDGADEVLVPHDVEVDQANQTLKNVILDDEFGQDLARIPAGEILVFIDACHSGSATKAVYASGWVPKYLHYQGMPLTGDLPPALKSTGLRSTFSVEENKSFGNYASLSAAQDNEKAIATQKGSLFTLALLKAAESAAEGGREITLDQLRLATAGFIENAISDPEKVHHPQLMGNETLFNRPYKFSREPQTPASDENNPAWTELVDLANAASHKITVRANQERFKIGDQLILSCEVDREGYLNILNLGPGETKPTVLFPNRLHQDNKVAPGQTITIPAPGDKFRLTARPPLGKTLVVVYHTQKDINGFREGQGSSKDLFMTLSPQSSRGFAVEQQESVEYFGAGLFVVPIE